MVVCWCILSMCCSVLFCCRKCQLAACVFHEFWEVIWDISHVSASVVLLHLTFQFFNAYTFAPDISSVSAVLLSHYASSLCILINVQATIMAESSLWCATVIRMTWSSQFSNKLSFEAFLSLPLSSSIQSIFKEYKLPLGVVAPVTMNLNPATWYYRNAAMDM